MKASLYVQIIGFHLTKSSMLYFRIGLRRKHRHLGLSTQIASVREHPGSNKSTSAYGMYPHVIHSRGAIV